MPHTLNLLFPSLAQFGFALEVVLLALLASGLGRLVSGDPRPTSLLSGWGAAVFAFVVLGTLTPLSFRLISDLLLAGALAGLILLWRDRHAVAPDWGRALRIIVLALPIILLAAGMRASQWDELSHWLPNGRYLALHDHFPTLALPNSASVRPAYPEALPLAAYEASLLLGRFNDRAGIIFNLLLLLLLAWTTDDLLVARGGAQREAEAPMRRWGRSAAALLIALPLNPSFLPKVALSNYTDSATSCALALMALSVARCVGAWRQGASGRQSLFAIGWATTVVVGLRDANFVLVGLVLCAAATLLLRATRSVRRRAFPLVLTLLPAMVVLLLWWRYCAAQIQSQADAPHVLPLSEWHFTALGQVLGVMGHFMIDKGAHFALMTAVSACGLAMFWRRRAADGEAPILCWTTAICFVGYTGFLALAAIGTSLGQDSDFRDAPSFWRYSTHLGGLALIAAISLVRPWLRVPDRFATLASAGAAALVLLLPAIEVRHLRFDVEHPHDGYLLAVSRDLASALPADAPVLLLDFHHNGSNLMLVRYSLLFGRERDQRATLRGILTASGGNAVLAAQDIKVGDYVWFADGGADLRKIFGLELSANSSELLLRETTGYRLVKEWPATPATEVFAPADFE